MLCYPSLIFQILLSTIVYSCDVTMTSDDGQLDQTHKLILFNLSSMNSSSASSISLVTVRLQTIVDSPMPLTPPYIALIMVVPLGTLSFS